MEWKLWVKKIVFPMGSNLNLWNVLFSFSCIKTSPFNVWLCRLTQSKNFTKTLSPSLCVDVVLRAT